MSEVRNKQVPRWVLDKAAMTQQQWKSRKRRELKQAIAAVSRFNVGAAYTPVKSITLIQLYMELKDMQKQLSIKNWGKS